MEVTIYHNPKCSKSRSALKILQEAGIECTVREYLKEPPSLQELSVLQRGFAGDLVDLVRSKEAKELGLSLTDERSEDEWLQLLVENPKLLQRPLVQIEDEVLVARPPELLFAYLI